MPVERHWDGEEALLSYQESLQRPGTNAEVEADSLFRSLINRYAALAAQSTLQLALHAFDDNVRLRASKYLVDWKLKLMELESANDPLADLVSSLNSSDDTAPIEPTTGAFPPMHSPPSPGDSGDHAAPVVDAEVVEDAPVPSGHPSASGTGAMLVAPPTTNPPNAPADGAE